MSDVVVEVKWDRELRFTGTGRGGVPVIVDGAAQVGPSPMESLLMALASCMGIDVVDVLEKMRVPLEGLAVRAEADRRPDPPRRYTAIRLTYETKGIHEEARSKLQRAIDLSRDKYCSVLHTLQPDVDLSIHVEMG